MTLNLERSKQVNPKLPWFKTIQTISSKFPNLNDKIQNDPNPKQFESNGSDSKLIEPKMIRTQNDLKILK